MNPELSSQITHTDRIRSDAVAQMAAIGINDDFISLLVDNFYARVLRHPELGAVFDARLHGRWPEHMLRMKAFWSAVAFRTGAYGGKPVQAHAHVANITPNLFTTWLEIFSSTLDDIAPSPQAKEWFMDSATRVARSLSVALFYNPADDLSHSGKE